MEETWGRGWRDEMERSRDDEDWMIRSKKVIDEYLIKEELPRGPTYIKWKKKKEEEGNRNGEEERKK